jgi:hypothetical protein
MFDKLKAQSNVILKITSEVDKLRGDGEGNPLDRLRFLERRFNDIFGEPGTEPWLSPFKQQKLMDKVDYLESTVSQQTESITNMEKMEVEVPCTQPGASPLHRSRLFTMRCCRISAHASSAWRRHCMGWTTFQDEQWQWT